MQKEQHRAMERTHRSEATLVPAQKSTEGKPQFKQYNSTPVIGIRNRIRRFTASWFSVTMGTGMVNTLLYLLPWEDAHPIFRGIGLGFLALDFILFVMFASMYTARSYLYPEIFQLMLSHTSQSLFVGTIPIGYTSLIGDLARLFHDFGSVNSVLIISGFWWVGLIGSCLVTFYIPWAMFTRHEHSTQNLTATWLLPIVPPITVALTGGNLVEYLTPAYPVYALGIYICCYVMLGIGLVLALLFLSIYIQRLAVHHLPDRDAIVSTFLPLGPCGQGGFSILALGRLAHALFDRLASAYPDNEAYHALSQVSLALYGGSIIFALLLWGLGLWWLFLAIMSVKSISVTSLTTFNMGFWSLVFPLGSLAMLTFALAQTFDALLLRVIGTVFSAAVFALWFLVAVPTTLGFLRGTLFNAPCLDSLPPHYGQPAHEHLEFGMQPTHDHLEFGMSMLISANPSTLNSANQSAFTSANSSRLNLTDGTLTPPNACIVH